jgi:ABC-type antimicrobial peptide transport system ATPase subunit
MPVGCRIGGREGIDRKNCLIQNAADKFQANIS